MTKKMNFIMRLFYPSIPKRIDGMTMTQLLIAIIIASSLSAYSTVNAQNNAEWPAFHGFDRQNLSQETGLLKSWPANGPQLAMTISGLGDGYSSVAIADGLIYTSGVADNQTFVFCFDMNGKQVWKKANGPAWTVQVSWASAYNGPRSTPTVDDGIVYHLSEASNLSAYNAKTGNIIWSRLLTRDFDATIPDYGYTESILVDGDRLYAMAAGKKGFAVCLNKKTGAIIWTNTEVKGTHGYGSFVIKETGNYKQLIGTASNCYYGIDTKTGKLLWSIPCINRYNVICTDAVVFDDYVIMSAEEQGTLAYKFKPTASGISVEKAWTTELMDNYHGGILFHDGYLYGSGETNRGWYCLDAHTGKQMWKVQGKGSLTYADGMLYLLEENGTLKLVKASPGNYEEVSELKIPKGGTGAFWAHPVICNGKLFIRHADKIFAYNIK